MKASRFYFEKYLNSIYLKINLLGYRSKILKAELFKY